MADLYDYDHVYTVAPPLWFNPDRTVTVQMKVIPQTELEQQARLEAVLDVESRGKKAQELIASKVLKIEGLKVSGKEVTTYEELRKNGPNELIKWLQMAVFSTQILSEAEVKN
jgi:hypothetical protein